MVSPTGAMRLGGSSSSAVSGGVMSSIGSSNPKDVIMESVERGLTCLGDSPKHAVFYVLKYRFRLGLCDIPDHPQSLVAALRDTFGISAQILERAILHELRRAQSSNTRAGNIMSSFVTALERDLSTFELEARNAPMM